MFTVINKLTLKLTSYCELACEYCHQLNQDKKKHQHFNDFKGLEAFLKQVNLADFVEVTLTGGEVTDVPELYAAAVKMFKRIERHRDVKFDFAVVSNGTKLEMLFDWIARGWLNPKRTAISWDGLNNASRSRKAKHSRYDDAFYLDMIKRLGASPYAQQIAISHAISPSTIELLSQSFQYAVESGVRNIGYYYVHEADYSDPAFVKVFERELEQIALLFTSRYPKLNQRFIYWNWQLQWSKRCLDQSALVASTSCHKLGRTLHIDPAGGVYPCVYFGDHRAFQLGELNQGIDAARLLAFNEAYFETPRCDIATCQHHQCFECPAAGYVHRGSMANRFTNTCHLLAIEARVFQRYIDTLQITMYDRDYYWLDTANLGSKNYHEKKQRSTPGLPMVEPYLERETVFRSNTEQHVKSWVLKPV